MKFLIRVFALGCIALAFSLISQAQSKPCQPDSAAEHSRHESMGSTWVVIIIPAKTPRQCVIEIISKLHKEQPTKHFEVFDHADGELSNYIRWVKLGMNESDYYPKEFMKKHYLASLYLLSGNYGFQVCQWTIKFEKGEDALLDRTSCLVDKN